MRQEYFVGWTEEDIGIWQARKITANRIHMRYQHHVKECELMRKLSEVDMPASEAKFTYLALMP